MSAVARFRSVVVDCPEPRELARFYARVCGGTPEDDDTQLGESHDFLLEVGVTRRGG